MKILLPLVLSMVAGAREATAQEAECERERAVMVETIRDYARSGAAGDQGISARVLEAMARTRRHLFIPDRSCSIAYADMPVSIGHGQTISQPFIVALMTELAAIAPDHVVLEVGTGSGYQAAVLAHLARKVCTIEIVAPLAEAAAKHSKISPMTTSALGRATVSAAVLNAVLSMPSSSPPRSGRCRRR